MEVAEKERTPGLSLGEERNMVTQLLLVNITVFILLFFISIIYQMEQYGLPAFNRDVLLNTQLSATPATVLHKPWTVLTAMFSHLGFWNIFSNMVWLFCFGSILQQQAGYKQVLPMYVLGSVCGYITYIIGMQQVSGIPGFSVVSPVTGIMGASAGVMAMAAGITAYSPGLRVFPALWRGGVPAWIFTLLFVALHITSIVTNNAGIDSVFYMAGGAIFGIVFMIRYKKGSRSGEKMHNALTAVSHMFGPKKKQAAGLTTAASAEAASKSSPAPFVKVGHVPEHRLNEILDKINAQGIESLSPEDREILLRASKEED